MLYKDIKKKNERIKMKRKILGLDFEEDEHISLELEEEIEPEIERFENEE